jgi:uncharacterized protein YndB with AHSA1/START domain
MSRLLVATVSAFIDAPSSAVYKALTDAADIKQYFFGSTVTSDWKKGSPITWKGEWQGRSYEDKGTILANEPNRKLEYSHFSPLTGKPDLPENYHTVTVELSPEGTGTRVTLSQDNNETEEAREHSTKNWKMMLGGLKKHVESRVTNR